MSTANLVHIQNDDLSLAVDPHGAQMVSLRTAAGQELLWQGDPAYWPDHALILFPLIGPLPDDQLQHKGQSYPMPPHGFAKDSGFDVVERTDTRCVFELQDSNATHKHYPFAFTLNVEFELNGGQLLNTISVTNPNTEMLPADVGFHPGFNWPLAEGESKAGHRIVFERAEPAPIRRGPGDPIFLYPVGQPTPVEGDTLKLRDELFEAQAMVFDQLQSHALTYQTPGSGDLRIAFPDSSQLALWMRPGATFIAIEPWQGLPAEVGFDGPFIDKPGIAQIEPGETRQWRLGVQFENSER